MDFETFQEFPYPRTDLPIRKQSEYTLLQMDTKLLHERTIKVAVIGHTGSGKRSFVKRLLHNQYVNYRMPMITFEFESIHEVRKQENIIWLFAILPGADQYVENCWQGIQDAEAVIICRGSKADDEDDEVFFRTMKETIRKHTQHASIFAVYTKNDRQSMEYEPYPPNLMKGIHYLGMTSAKLYTGFEGLLDKIYTHLPPIPYRIAIEEDDNLSEPDCCCFM